MWVSMRSTTDRNRICAEIYFYYNIVWRRYFSVTTLKDLFETVKTHMAAASWSARWRYPMLPGGSSELYRRDRHAQTTMIFSACLVKNRLSRVQSSRPLEAPAAIGRKSLGPGAPLVEWSDVTRHKAWHTQNVLHILRGRPRSTRRTQSISKYLGRIRPGRW